MRNSKTQEVKDVTPASPSGAAPMSKQEREMKGYFQGAKNLGYSDEQAGAIAVNKGKLPSDDLHPDERKKITDLADMASNGNSVVNNIDELKKISPTAWGHPGALDHAKNVAGYLPSAITPQGAIQLSDKPFPMPRDRTLQRWRSRSLAAVLRLPKSKHR